MTVYMVEKLYGTKRVLATFREYGQALGSIRETYSAWQPKLEETKISDNYYQVLVTYGENGRELFGIKSLPVLDHVEHL